MKKLNLLFLIFPFILHSQYTQLGGDIDGESFGDFSGWDCTLSEDGNILCVGEKFNNEGTPSSGSGSNFGQVRCYEWDGTNWQPLGDETHGQVGSDNFGNSVSLNNAGNIYIAGAPGNDNGYARVHQLTGGVWQQLGGTLLGENPGDSFGVAVSINGTGNIIAISAPGNDTNGSQSGQTRIYQLNGTNWQQLGNPINGIDDFDLSGSSVSLSNDGLTIAIGAQNDDSTSSSLGAVRIYQYNGTDWVLKGPPIIGTDVFSQHGNSVSLNNNATTVAIGAQSHDGNGSNGGRVEVYEFDGTNWIQKGQNLNGAFSNDNFGRSVSIDAAGNTLLVGADGSAITSNPGRAIFYEYDGTNWMQVGAVIDAENTMQSPAQYFGYSTAISSDGLTGAIGDYNNQNEGDTFPIPKGSTRAYRRTAIVSQDPVASCMNITIQLDATGTATISAMDIDNGSFDADGSVTLSINQSSFNCNTIGANTVTLTVTDSDSNTDACNATVTVEDSINPSITCPTNQNANINTNCMYSIPDYTTLGIATDNCGAPVITQTPVAGTQVSTGITTITLIANDGSNTNSCTFDLVVTDTTLPSAICMAPFTIMLDASGTASISATDVDNVSIDNCGITAMSIDQTDFNCDNIGENTITLTVMDAEGNINTCTTIVTVEDPLFACNMPPVALCQEIIMNADEDCLTTVTASDFDNGSFDPEGETVTFTITPPAPYSIGTTNVTLTVSDGLTSSDCFTTITVNDNIPPVLNCLDDQEENVTDNCNFILPDYTIIATAEDTCGSIEITQTPVSGSIINSGETIVTLTASDGTNTSSCEFTVTVIDTILPTAICQNIIVSIDNSGTASITASQIDNGSNDNCGIVISEISTSQFTCENIGDNEVTLTVIDEAGNEDSCVAIVTVIDTIAPIVQCQNITIELDENGMASISASDLNNNSTDNCGNITASINTTEFDCTSIGTNIVILTITDENGNSDSCEATVTVIDTIAPMIECQNIEVILDANGVATITPQDIENSSNDNCSISGSTINMDTFTCENIGANEVTLTVTDQSGNTTTCIALVTVEDDISPIAQCQNITVEVNNAGNAIITADDIDGGSMDECSNVTLNIDNNIFTCDQIGENEVTLTVTDASGNSSSCKAIVTVTNNFNAEAICQNITAVLDENGSTTITPLNVYGGDLGTCPVNNLSIDIDTFTCEQAGTMVPVTLTATAADGTTNSCIAQVNIVDNIPPMISCPNETLIVPALEPFIIPDYVSTEDVTISDNCVNQVEYEQNPTAGTKVLAGETVITLTAIDPSGNTATCQFTIFVDPSLGVLQEDNLTSLIVYPNPADLEITLNNPNNIHLNKARIMDISGRLIQTVDLSNMATTYTIDISKLVSASYFLVVENNVTKQTFQIIKK